MRIAAALLFPAPKRPCILKSSLPVAIAKVRAQTVANTCPSVSATIGRTTALNQSSYGMFIFWWLGVRNLFRSVVKSDCSTAFLAGIIAVAVSGIQWVPSPLGLRLLGVWATASSSFAGLVWPNANTSKTLTCSGARRFARSYIWMPGYLSRMAAQGPAAKNSKAKHLSKATSYVIALRLERITSRANSGVACVAWSAFLSRSGRFLALISVISPTTANLATGSWVSNRMAIIRPTSSGFPS